MNTIIHSSAKASHYNKEAEQYDIFNEKNSIRLNKIIEKILNKHRVKTVLDLSCGTGSQVFWLAKRHYKVVGVDINAKMLKIAKDKNQMNTFRQTGLHTHVMPYFFCLRQ